MNSLSCSGEAAEKSPGLACLIVWELESGKTITEFLGIGTISFALQMGKKPQSVLFFKYQCEHGCWVDCAASLYNTDIQ